MNKLYRIFLQTKTIRRLILVCSFTFALMISGCSAGWEIANPYEKVEWDIHQRFKANFHAHTTCSDGRLNPQTVVDKYHRLGYRILAITDHNRITYPWTDFAEMEPSERSKERLEKGEINQEALVYENRDPFVLGMISVQGNEISTPHHVGSYFSDYNQRSEQEEIAFASTESSKGIAVINHPGRYTSENPKKYNANWYIDILTRFDHLVGMEIYNQADRYPTDRQSWDSVLVDLMPDRPVWGFANDDFHGDLNKLGVSWNVLILPELTEEWVRRGMKEGRFFYVHAVEGHQGHKPPNIESIKVSNRKGTIEIQVTGEDSIRWISNGRVVQRGNVIRLGKIPKIFGYVRAEIFGPGTIIGTQPFGIVDSENK